MASTNQSINQSFSCSQVYSSEVLLKELSCHGLISLRFLKFLVLSGQVTCDSFLCLLAGVIDLTTRLFISRVGVVILSPEAVLCLDWCCRAFQTHSLWKPPSCTKTTKGSQLLQLLGLVLYGLGNWLYPVALILSCIISCTFFFLFFEPRYLMLLSFEYQLHGYFTALLWMAKVLFWKFAQLLLLFFDGEVLACDPSLQRYVRWLSI